MRLNNTIIGSLLLSLSLLVAGGCIRQSPEANQSSDPKPVAAEKLDQHPTGQGKKILIAYFSHSGNTKVFAESIQKQVGGSLWAIEPQVAYSKVYNKVVDQAKGEVNSKHTPKLATRLANIRDYDIIFIGTPIWWYTVAPPVRTFLTEYDMTDKIIIPFSTHKGSGLSGIGKTMQEIQPQAKVLEGLAIWDDQASSKQADIQNWLRGLKL